MSIAEQIYAIVKSLPQEQASEILTYAEFIRAKHLNANRPVGTVRLSSLGRACLLPCRSVERRLS
ncbi:DUF2281 domain-containing protein [Myxacorys almedinensis]|uniref:DUF2281 domain-containing protein n=1 Tax=Myxacorys almedinensis TaxID=2651157 RepID=UPI001EE42169|nr:DUF2281 domain-containing protein [Myxacorys almedinensis]